MAGRPARPIQHRAQCGPAGVEGDCWICTSHSRIRGIPQLGRRIDGQARCFSIPRLIYEAAHGPVPAGLWIRAICGNRACINPTHLVAGTKSESLRASGVRLGRPRQERAPQLGRRRKADQKLTRTQRAVLTARARAGESPAALGREYGVSRQYVHQLKRAMPISSDGVDDPG